VEFWLILQCQALPQNCKAPLLKTFWRRFWYEALWSRVKETWVCSKESTCTECSFCFHRSVLNGELHSEFEDMEGVKKCKTH